MSAEYAGYYANLLKLNLSRILLQSGMLILFVAVAVALALGYGAMQVPGGPLAAIAAAAILAILALLIFFWVMNCFDNAAYVLTDAMLEKKPYHLADALGKVAGKSMRFTIVDSVLRLVLLIPVIILLLIPFAGLLTGTPAGGVLFIMGIWIAVLVFTIYRMVVDLAYHFVTQFWKYGFVLGSDGLIDSLKGGAGLVRSKFLETIVMDFIIIVITLIASLPLIMFSLFMYFALLFAQFMLMLIFPYGLLVYAALVFVVAIVAVFLSTIAEMAWRPLHMLFWKKASGRQ